MKDTYAEFETDRIIREKYFPNFIGTMVEVGCADPELYSMSMLFRQNNWRCIGIEPNPFFAEKHRALNHEIYEYAINTKNKKNVDFYMVNDYGEGSQFTFESMSSLGIQQGYMDKDGTPSNVQIIKVECKTLNSILKMAEVDKIDFLSIDTEGWELDVMKSFSSEKYSPKVILLENYLHSDRYTEYMNRIGYQLDMKVEYNYLYTKL